MVEAVEAHAADAEPADEPVTFATAETAGESDSQSDIETLPTGAIVAISGPGPGGDAPRAAADAVPLEMIGSCVPSEQAAGIPGPAATPPEPSAKPKPAGRPAPKARRTRRQRRATNVKRLAVALVVVLSVASAVTFWIVRDRLGPPSADDRWAELMQQYDEHKWDRFGRRLDDFAEDFPDDPRVAQIPFFRDMAAAGDDIYSLTGDAERGLATIQQIFRDHRDNPAYREYSIDIYQGLTKLIDRLLEQAVAASDRGKLHVVRGAFGLLETVGQARAEPFVREKIDQLRSKIAQSEHTVEGALARQRMVDLLSPEKIADPHVNLDAIYDQVKRTMAARPELGDDPELIRLLDEAYRAEPQRVFFEPEAAQTGSFLPAVDRRDRTRQGCTLVVAWGGEAEGSPRSPAADLPTDPDRIVLALARGILYAFDKPSGELVWARRLGVDSRRLPTPIEPTETSPAALIAVNSEDNRLLALERATGRVLWRYRVGHDVVAPLLIVPRQPDPNAPVTPCGLLPTAEGEIHVLELVLGKRLGRFVVDQPLTLGGCYDPQTRLVFFPADAERIFAIDPAAIDDPKTPACRSILFSGHASGGLRCEPIVVGQYLILLEASQLEHTRLRAFTLRGKGFGDPTSEPVKELSLNGWAWFSPQVAPDRITLVTDEGDLGLFGLNLDNEREAIYPIVEQVSGQPAVPLSSHDAFRTMVVWTEEHLVWIMAGGHLQKLAVDLLRQEVRPLWSDATAGVAAGVPVHEPQVDSHQGVFYLTTMSPSGHVYRLTAVDAETGRPHWYCRLGLSVLGDPLLWEDHVVIVDRSGQTLVIRPGDRFYASELPRLKRLPHGQGLPPGADESRMLRLGKPPGPIHLVVPIGDGNQLAVRTIAGPHDPGGDWTRLALPNRLHGRPCVCDDFLVIPCDDGQLYRVPLDGRPDNRGTNEIAFTWARSKPPGPNVAEVYPLGPGAVLLVDDQRLRFRRLKLQRTVDGVVQWKREGREFFLSAPMRGRPLVADQGVFVLDAAGTLHLLDPANPNHRRGQWPIGAKVAVGPFLRGGRLLAISDDQRIVCFAPDRADGADGADGARPVPWISEPFRGRIRGMPAAADGTLLVADGSRYLSGVRLEDGTVAWKAPLGVRVGPSAAPVPYGGQRMLVPLADGTLLVLPIPKEQVAEAKK